MDSDSKFDALLRRDCGVALDHLALDLYRAAHRVDDAAEGNQQSVAGGLDDRAAVRLDQAVDGVAAMDLQPAVSAFFIVAHEAAVAGDIGGENGREATVGSRFRHGDTLRKAPGL